MRSVVLVALVVCGCGKASSDPAGPAVQIPGITSDGVDLTYKDLLEKIKAGGYPKATMSPTRYGQMYALEQNEKTHFPSIEAAMKDGAKLSHFDQPLFICEKKASANAAKEDAGKLEKGAWVWGTFVFFGTEKTLDMLKKALAK